jgi:excisionase family DNA binding protein
MSTADYSPEPGEHSPLELEASTSEPTRTQSPPEVEGLSVTDAAGAYGVSVSTIRRLLKSGKLAGVLVPGPKGSEYRVRGSDLEALGYRVRGTVPGATLTAARAGAEVEALSAKVSELEARLDLERVRRESAEREAEVLAQSLEDLRLVISKLPAALPAGSRRKLFGRSRD